MVGILVAYGHSWAFGTGASRGDLGFVARAAGGLGLRPDNRGESGSLSTETARLVAISPPPAAALFVLMTGLNDGRRYGPSPTARAAYADAVALVLGACHRAGPAATVLALAQPYLADYSGYPPFDRGSDAVVEAYNAILRVAASRSPFARVVTLEGWQVDTMVAADGVHPNDAGHRHLAQAVVGAVPRDVIPAS